MNIARLASHPAYPWLLTCTLFFCAALNYADRTAVSSVFPLLQREFAMSDVVIAAVGSSFLWSYAFASPFSGLLADRVSRSRLVLFSLLAWSSVTAATAFVPNSHWLLFARALLGLSECLYLPAAIALIADYHPVSTRGTAMAIHIAGLNAGMVVGGSLGGYLGQHYGWRIMFLSLGGAGLLIAAVSAVILRDPARPKRDSDTAQHLETSSGVLESLRQVITVPTYLIIIAEAALVSIGTWVFANWLPLYFAETFHMSLAGAGFSGTFTIQAGGVLGTVLGGSLSDWAARRQRRGRMLVQCVCLGLSAPFLLSFVWSRSYALISLSIFFYQFLAAMSSSAEHPIVCDVLDARLRSTAIGCMNTVNCLAGGCGVLLAGFFKRDFGLSAIFAAASGIVLLAAILLLAGYRFFLDRDLAVRRSSAVRPETAPAAIP
jgi:predicted MFS family arabinose efflux permease